MKYRVILSSCTADEELEHAEKVNKAIKNGWRPQGGVALHVVAADDDEPIMVLAQAMVKDDKQQT